MTTPSPAARPKSQTRNRILVTLLILTLVGGWLHATPARADFYASSPAQTTEIPYPQPNPDPRCETNWILAWHFDSEKYCGGWHYWLFFCVIELFKHDSIYVAVCTPSNPLYFPLLLNQIDD